VVVAAMLKPMKRRGLERRYSLARAISWEATNQRRWYDR
jgi:hypothetical protein